jgi:phosphoserine phosphatase RsbU/P
MHALSLTDADRISRVIFDYAARVGNAPSTDALLTLNAQLARDLVGADRCSVWLIDSGSAELWTKVAHGVDEIRIPAGQGLVGACISANDEIVVNDTALDERFLGDLDQTSGYSTQSAAMLPLRDENGQAIGALQALNKSGGFSRVDVNLLRLSAAYCAAAIATQRFRQIADDARCLYRELEIARDVQQQLFPQNPPCIQGLDYAAFCRPTAFVGGDYYDFVIVPGGKIAITLGDVSGKGIAAAVLMASIQSSLRSQLLLAPDSLARLMTDFNSAVHSFSREDNYTTLFCGLLDLSTQKLTYVNAGHIPPLLLRGAKRDAAMTRLETGGFPIGLFKVANYEQGTVELKAGDIVLCHSDGFSDAANLDGQTWGDEPVAQVLDQNRDCGVQEILARLVAAADAFTGTAAQADDMTAVAVRLVV